MRLFTQSQKLWAEAQKLVPGGMPAHLSPQLLVRGQSPCFIERAEGCRFWDVDGHEYIDYMCAYGPMILGYNHPKVEAAVAAQKKKGDCFSLPSPLWVELAKRMVDLITAADWVTFGKNGTDVCNLAVRVARAHTGRSKILMAQGSYHGIGAWCTPIITGVTEEERLQVLSFPYNDPAALENLLKQHGPEVAAVIITPFKHETSHDQEMPTEAFISGLNTLTRPEGPLLILDDVRGGFRLDLRGSAEYIGLKPHLSCFSKAMGNGYPISALCGAKELMSSASKVFFTGSFFAGAEALAASLATLQEMVDSRSLEHIFRMGEMLKQGLLDQAASLGLKINYTGPVTIPFMTFEDDKKFEKSRAFCARAYQEGVFFHPYHNWFLSAAHQEEDIRETLLATQKAFEAVKEKA
ncbi:MAG: aminotransferase class III-fold pyridoxal phosphate-dependent enzyme [Deltaproteobacteria bacterium]|nr:aminotransferase class III-fold pyridoxal phosphate-dependent enzyme [Deltaproteobacteria bacterium]